MHTTTTVEAPTSRHLPEETKNALIKEITRISAMARLGREAIYGRLGSATDDETDLFHLLDTIVDMCERLLDVDCDPSLRADADEGVPS